MFLRSSSLFEEGLLDKPERKEACARLLALDLENDAIVDVGGRLAAALRSIERFVYVARE